MYLLNVVDQWGNLSFQMFNDRQAAEDEAITQLKAGAVLARVWYQGTIILSLNQRQLAQFIQKEKDNE